MVLDVHAKSSRSSADRLTENYRMNLSNIRAQPFLSKLNNIEMWIRLLSMFNISDLSRFSQTCRLADFVVHVVTTRLLSPILESLDSISRLDVNVWHDIFYIILFGEDSIEPINRAKCTLFTTYVTNVGSNVSAKALMAKKTVAKAATADSKIDTLKFMTSYVSKDDGRHHKSAITEVTTMDAFIRSITSPKVAKKASPIPKPVPTNKYYTPLNLNLSDSTFGMTIENLVPLMIAYCKHTVPMRHTCVYRKVPTASRFNCELISLSDFMSEVYERMKQKQSRTVSLDIVENKIECFSAFCLFHLLRAILHIFMSKLKAEVYFRKVEFLSSTGAEIHHRVWLQILIGYNSFNYYHDNSGKKADNTKSEVGDSKSKKKIKAYEVNVDEYSNSFYLTLYDHFQLVL